jgi:polyisoprenoid-binding protein YceI
MSLKKSILALAVLAFPLSLAAPVAVFAADAIKVAKTTAYSVDTATSSIKWLGKKVTGQHHGTIAIKSGDLRVANGEVVGGNFVIDTTTIADEDLDAQSKQKLEGHLKSDDFFSVANYPTSKFEITSIEPIVDKTHGATHKVTGNLTIKDITHPLSFPATINVTPKMVSAEAKGVAVDRTLYNIKYGSGKFFQGLGDKVINDLFWLDIKLVAKK